MLEVSQAKLFPNNVDLVQSVIILDYIVYKYEEKYSNTFQSELYSYFSFILMELGKALSNLPFICLVKYL